MINYYYIAIKRSIEKIGLIWFSLYVVLSFLIKVKKKFFKIFITIFPSYSNNFKNLKYKYNKLFDYEKVKNFHIYDRKQLINKAFNSWASLGSILLARTKRNCLLLKAPL